MSASAPGPHPSMSRSAATRRRLVAAGLTVVVSVATATALVPAARATGSGSGVSTPVLPSQAYRAGDYADGQAMSILPPGENGTVTTAQLLQYELTHGTTRPPNSQDQLGPYSNLLFGSPSLTDATLSSYYDDESFGVPAGQVQRTETPSSAQFLPGSVKIVRDSHDVPHIYGSTDESAAFGAGYAQAEDRLFLMDVLRHYGEGTLSAFIGPSCADEQMDHDELLLAPYTQAQAQAQVDALPQEYGAEGTLAVKMITSYVAGINDYIAHNGTNPLTVDGDYAFAANSVPQPWTDADVVAIAGLIGGIFGKGGGIEVANSALYTYLQQKLGATAGAQAFAELKEQNDPSAPTTVVDKTFPYEQTASVNPALTAIPDHPQAPLVGGPTDTTPGCSLTPSNPTVLAAIASLAETPKHMSNALVVNAQDTAAGHPIAVFGPQVSYFAPQILSEEEISAPDLHAEGASFPGTGLVELGRGVDYAWSATSAGSDLVDQRLELTCNPDGGTPSATEPYYVFDGQCLPMTHEVFTETAFTKPGGLGAPTVIRHDIYLTRHGVVQGWTTADGGKPVAVVNQRSTYNHDIDSVVGFLRWGQPSQTTNATTWMAGAADIDYTFNWFYVDSRDTAYYASGLDPIRAPGVDPNLPTWGTGDAEWQGYLPADQHVHEIDPAQGFFVSWNNKPAPGFSAADDQYGYGPVYRSQMLVAQLKAQLAATGNKLTRSNVVQAMEGAATQDLDGLTVAPQLLALAQGQQLSPGVTAMLAQLQSWVADGAHRIKASPSATQYEHASAIAIMDELEPRLIEAIWNPLLAGGGGVTSTGSNGGASTPGYAILPMQFTNTPNSGDAHLGSAYDGGWEGYMVKTLEQLRGQSPVDPFTSVITSTWCGGGPSTCKAAITTALNDTYQALVKANGSTNVASWTKSSELVADEQSSSSLANETMPQYDAISFRPLGVVTQPAIDWQNRPTFQQVVQFPAHRP